MSEPPLPKGVAVYDRPAPARLNPVAMASLLLGVLAATAAGLHYFHYF